jgi:hypothetical protein
MGNRSEIRSEVSWRRRRRTAAIALHRPGQGPLPETVPRPCCTMRFGTSLPAPWPGRWVGARIPAAHLKAAHVLLPPSLPHRSPSPIRPASDPRAARGDRGRDGIWCSSRGRPRPRGRRSIQVSTRRSSSARPRPTSRSPRPACPGSPWRRGRRRRTSSMLPRPWRSAGRRSRRSGRSWPPP